MGITETTARRPAAIAFIVYLVGFFAQAAYSMGMAVWSRASEGRLWPYPVAAAVMMLVLALLTWQRSRRIKRIALSALSASLTFIILASILATVACGSAEPLVEIFLRALYQFVLTGVAWVSFLVSIAVAGLATQAVSSGA